MNQEKIMKKSLIVLIVLLIMVAVPTIAQNASYLDALYQGQQNAEDNEPTELDRVDALKESIFETYDIHIVDDEVVNQWSEDWLIVVEELLAALPEEFRSSTKIISLDPNFMPYEIKYNGFDDRDGEIMVGYGAMVPPRMYLRKFKQTYDRLPSDTEKIARFKSILVRGMTYAFQQANPDIAARWRQFPNGQITTKVFGPGQDQNMVVSPVLNPGMVDMAFSVALYCADGSKLQGISSERYNFIRDYIMAGQSVSGWGSSTLIDDGSSDDNGQNSGDGTVEKPGERPPPDIPDGDYLPVFTEADVGTAAASIPEEYHSAPDLLKSAIVELFEVLPKFFSTCTEAIVYLPTTDTEAAFSSEGYVFVTQNSWHAPSFVDLDDAARSARFKRYLLSESARRFLYFHPEVSEEWQETFAENQSLFEVYEDICKAVVLYVQNPQWLKDLNPERYNFIQTKVMDGKQFL
jgi:hypothetical protein